MPFRLNPGNKKWIQKKLGGKWKTVQRCKSLRNARIALGIKRRATGHK